MDPKIEAYLADLLPKLYQHGVQLKCTREIQYGWQLELHREKEKLKLNVYQSKQVGVNTLVNKGGGAGLEVLVRSV
ncbi:MAG: hypothetical protein V3576_02480, partial [Candidatus Cloacimonadota bacterium]